MRLRSFFYRKTAAYSNSLHSRLRATLLLHYREYTFGRSRVTRSRQRGTIASRLDERGFSTLGGCLTVVAIIVGVGLIGIIYRTQDLARVQINMDQCTGRFVMGLRAAAKTLEESYERLEVERAITTEGCATILACPGFLKFFDAAAKVERGIQMSAKIYWLEQSYIWKTPMLAARCTLPESTVKNNFPSFDFPIIKGDKTDLVETKTTSFLLALKKKSFDLSLEYKNLISVANLERTGPLHGWKIYWSQ